MASRQAQARGAAHRAISRYPGPVGECLARTLIEWADCSFRFGGSVFIDRLIMEIYKESRNATQK
jgi:hypothetical protein